MKRLTCAPIMAAAMLVIPAVAFAVPVDWAVSGTYDDGGTVTGSFTYDRDTNTYSNIAITTTNGGTRSGAVYTAVHPDLISIPGTLLLAGAGGAAAGQPAASLLFAPILDNTTGNRAVGGSEGTCGSPCLPIQAPARLVTATLTSIVPPAPAPVPTLAEWAMILFGVMLAGGAAFLIQRRRAVYGVR